MLLSFALAAAVTLQAPKIEDAVPIDPATYRVEVVATDLNNPWNISWLPNGDMLVTERVGRLRVIRDGALLPDKATGVPEVLVRGQAGLFEASPHPDFATNQLLYLTYVTGEPDHNTLRLARGKYTATKLGGQLEDLEVLFTADAYRNSKHHYGGRILWLEDGTLMLTSGEGSRASYRVKAQSLDSHFGKILHLKDDGTPADDNPFLGKPDAKPEIWSYGHRNPQGIVMAPDGTIYSNEHGPRGGDEMNVVEKGKNYGWPAITYGIDYSGAIISPLTELDGMEQPLFHWTPSIAPSSLLYYDGDDFPQWQGKLMSTALAFRRVQIADPTHPDAQQQTLLSEYDRRVRDIALGPDGHLYVATDKRTDRPTGEIWRILPQE